MRRRLAEGSRAFCQTAARFTSRLSVRGPSGAVRVARVQRTNVAARLGRRRRHAHLCGMDKPLPTLFLSHGSPMLAVQDSRCRPLPRWPGQAIADAARDRRRLGAFHRRAHACRRGCAAAHRPRLRRLSAGAVRIALPRARPACARAGASRGRSMPPASLHASHPNTASTTASGCRCSACIRKPRSRSCRCRWIRAAMRGRTSRSAARWRRCGTTACSSSAPAASCTTSATSTGTTPTRRSRRGPPTSPTGCANAWARTTSTPSPTGKPAHRTRSARIRPSNT